MLIVNYLCWKYDSPTFPVFPQISTKVGITFEIGGKKFFFSKSVLIFAVVQNGRTSPRCKSRGCS